MENRDTRLSAELAGWLRYYRDLGFTHLYRRACAEPLEPPISTKSSTARADPGPPIILASQTEEAALKKNLPLDSSPQGISAPPVSSAGGLFEAVVPRETLEQIREDLGDCRRCKLWKGRKSIVFGDGNPQAQLVFVGEGPGADEDEQGLPFVGRAGQLLTDMIERGMQISRRDVYICNIVKCRPPENRKPEKDEVAACRQFVERQLDAIRPKAVCVLGATAAETLLGVRQSMASLRGRWYEFRGFPLLVSYHPAFLLRDPSRKRDSWADLKMILAHLALPPGKS